MIQWRLKETAKQIRSLFQTGLLAYPGNVQCNVCGWTGRRFVSDAWHKNVNCPKCGSGVRQRLFFGAIQHRVDLSIESLLKNKRVLHFAPERIFRDVVAGHAASYATADFLRIDCDLKLDMSNMREVENGSYDLILAFDVLEHVPDFKLALVETHRILADGGKAVFSVPQKRMLAETDEDPSANTAAERLKLFGQEDHLRIFGDDFPMLLEKHGFEVTVVDASSFSQDLVIRHVLFPPILSSHPLATNHRKIYFCKKQ
jgi:SAM-dependent methyltransferase